MGGPEAIEVTRVDDVATLLLARPRQRNALSAALMRELLEALRGADEDPGIGCVVIGGSEQAFSSGADIAEMANRSAIEFALSGYVEHWDAIRAIRTPIVAAVSGLCLGGGCELAMACDVIVASESARFGQPETGIGLIPGAGGTQRLVRAVGRAKAMDVILAGRMLDAFEAEEAGLVSRVVAREAWLTEAQATARAIATRAPLAQRSAKRLVDRAAEVPLSAGVESERESLYLLFASDDAREGLTAFTEKRTAQWQAR